jgi:hypothetical protein
MEPQEISQLLNYPHEPRIKTALMFIAATGCRLFCSGEAYLLEVVKDVGPSSTVLLSVHYHTGMGRSVRWLSTELPTRLVIQT